MTDEELKQSVASRAAENKRYFDESGDRLIEANRRSCDETFNRIADENQRFFEVTTDRLRHSIDVLAESLVQTQEALMREMTGLREDMRRGFAETRALLTRYSHADLDRRVTVLEEHLPRSKK